MASHRPFLRKALVQAPQDLYTDAATQTGGIGAAAAGLIRRVIGFDGIDTSFGYAPDWIVGTSACTVPT